MQFQNNFGSFIKSVGSCCGKSRQKNDSLAITQGSTITITVYENLHNNTKNRTLAYLCIYYLICLNSKIISRQVRCSQIIFLKVIGKNIHYQGSSMFLSIKFTSTFLLFKTNYSLHCAHFGSWKKTALSENHIGGTELMFQLTRNSPTWGETVLCGDQVYG